ncbi:MAG: cupredoxin domain-containing protein [Candidatus Limnocylindria bacterium]
MATLALVVAGCTGAPSVAPSPSAPAVVTVFLEDSTFIPYGGSTADGVPVLTVPVGTTVMWVNLDPIDHTATEYLEGFPKPDARFDIELTPKATGRYTFEEPGTYEVGCVPHPAMQMLVIVEGST